MRLRLTNKTRAIARFLVGGWNTESIAYQMGMTRDAVKTQCHRIIVATGQDSIVPAVMAILRDADAMHHIFDARKPN